MPIAGKLCLKISTQTQPKSQTMSHSSSPIQNSTPNLAPNLAPNLTHQPTLKSWILSANEATQDFSIQNLPFGVFTHATHATHATAAHVGIAIGDQILDLAALHQAGLLALPGAGADANPFCANSLNGFIALGKAVWHSVRSQVSALLEANNPTLRDNPALRQATLLPQSAATIKPIR